MLMMHLLGYGRWICSGELGGQEMLFNDFEGWDLHRNSNA